MRQKETNPTTKNKENVQKLVRNGALQVYSNYTTRFTHYSTTRYLVTSFFLTLSLLSFKEFICHSRHKIVFWGAALILYVIALISNLVFKQFTERTGKILKDIEGVLMPVRAKENTDESLESTLVQNMKAYHTNTASLFKVFNWTIASFLLLYFIVLLLYVLLYLTNVCVYAQIARTAIKF